MWTPWLIGDIKGYSFQRSNDREHKEPVQSVLPSGCSAGLRDDCTERGRWGQSSSQSGPHWWQQWESFPVCSQMNTCTPGLFCIFNIYVDDTKKENAFRITCLLPQIQIHSCVSYLRDFCLLQATFETSRQVALGRNAQERRRYEASDYDSSWDLGSDVRQR